jgi:hypothetical protein
LFFLAALAGGAPPYEAGMARLAGNAAAMVVRYRAEPPLALVTLETGELPRGLADLIAARLEKEYDIPRANVLLHYAANGPAVSDAASQAGQVVDLVGAALARFEPAALRWSSDFRTTALKVTAQDGHTRAVLLGRDGGLVLQEGDTPLALPPFQPVTGPLRAAFQAAGLAGLQARGAPPRLCPVQALAFGRELAVVALGGDAPAGLRARIAAEYGTAGVIVAARSNGGMMYDGSSETGSFDSVRELMRRVGRRSR